MEILSINPEDTLNLGEALGKNCRGGEVFFLSSDLGGGKTTLSKGIGSGLECEEQITSPTFTVSNIYKCRDNLEIHHFDFYRLTEAGVVGSELDEIIGDKKIITIIEWGDIVENVLPVDRVIIELKPTADSESNRQITIKSTSRYKYLLESLR